MDYKRKKVRLGDLLVESQVITQKQLDFALERQKIKNMKYTKKFLLP